MKWGTSLAREAKDSGLRVMLTSLGGDDDASGDVQAAALGDSRLAQSPPAGRRPPPRTSAKGGAAGGGRPRPAGKPGGLRPGGPRARAQREHAAELARLRRTNEVANNLMRAFEDQDWVALTNMMNSFPCSLEALVTARGL